MQFTHIINTISTNVNFTSYQIFDTINVSNSIHYLPSVCTMKFSSILNTRRCNANLVAYLYHVRDQCKLKKTLNTTSFNAIWKTSNTQCVQMQITRAI